MRLLTLSLLVAAFLLARPARAENDAVTSSGGSLVISRPPIESLPRLTPVRDLGFVLDARIGYHAYTGWHWRNNDRAAYDSPAVEVGGGLRLRETFGYRIDGTVSSGFYGGSSCEPDSPTSCVTQRLATYYFQAGPRATATLRRNVFLFTEAGIGIAAARFDYSVHENDPNYSNSGRGSTSAFVPAAHVAAGAGLKMGSIRFLLAGKYLSADAVLPSRGGSAGFFNQQIRIGAGGGLIFAGAQYAP